VGGASAPRPVGAQAANLGPTPRGAEAAPTLKWGAGTKVLLMGGGSSHDFDKWFNKADVATLGADPKLAINYTDNPAVVVSELPHVDVFVSSTNQPGFDTPDVRKALFDFVGAGKGVV